jgi:phosphotransferase system enzyme I (PtsI)
MVQGAFERKQLERLVSVPARTLDGLDIDVQINIEQPLEANQAVALGATGVGLFGTAFLFMNRTELPTEDEQHEAYRRAVLELSGRTLTIRTIDIGADKGWLSYASPYEGGAHLILHWGSGPFGLAWPYPMFF